MTNDEWDFPGGIFIFDWPNLFVYIGGYIFSVLLCITAFVAVNW